jgi:hypothetical protein
MAMDGANRWLGAMEARNGGDAVAGLAHDIDGYAALVHGAATIQSRRSAREKNYDVLLRRRENIMRGQGVTDMMYALGKREQAQSEFFGEGGPADASNRAPGPIRIPQHPTSSPQTHSQQQTHTPRRSQRRQDQRRCQPTMPTKTLPSFLPNNKPTHSSLLPFSTMLEAFRHSPTLPVAEAVAGGGGAGGSSQERGACSVLRGEAGEPSGAGLGGRGQGIEGIQALQPNVPGILPLPHNQG